MTITRETVEHVAKLARLELNPAEVDRYTRDLSRILQMVDELNALNLDDIDVALSLEHPAVLREDKPVREFTRDELLKNAPSEEEGFFQVPRILSESTNETAE